MGKTKKVYAVARGARPGIYSDWFGPEGAERQVRGFAGALYRGFASLTEAKQWLDNPGAGRPAPAAAKNVNPPAAPFATAGKIVVYTDGGCRGNPGPGGYGVLIDEGGKRRELARGYRLTTNNRMELMACIAALRALQPGAEVILHSDSRYVVNGIEKGWARKWRANGWMRTKTEPAQNSDLWEELLGLCEKRQVRFFWVHGHAGQAENERCDQLATTAAQGPDLLEDRGYRPVPAVAANRAKGA
ncbi:MAG: ribonuclease HI [Deltaproteobacteria bacterium]|nr:ribonuclease HI [Deltaproteobacteria bacterium]